MVTPSCGVGEVYELVTFTGNNIVFHFPNKSRHCFAPTATASECTGFGIFRGLDLL